VRSREDGSTKWVKSLQLISRDTSVENDVGRVVAGIAIAACILNPDECTQAISGGSSHSSSSSASPASYKFKFTNNCRHKIRIAMRYRTTNGNWTSAAWWTIEPNTWRYLNYTDGSYALTGSSRFYYYAEARDGSFYWSGGTSNIEVNGRIVSMIQADDDSGDSGISLKCPGR